LSRPAVFAAVFASLIASAAGGQTVRAASPAGPFPAPSVRSLPNGAAVVSQQSADMPLVDAQVVFPAGFVQQPSGEAGVAAVAAAMVLRTPVERSSDIGDVASSLGASVSYTVEPQDTRFSIESRADDLPRLLRDLASAVAKPDASQFAAARSSTLDAATSALQDPVLVAYSMVRQSQYQGTGFADPDAGRPLSLSTLSPELVAAFVGRYRVGHGAVVSLAGDVTDDDASAAGDALSDFTAMVPRAAARPSGIKRGAEIVAHRDVAAPWIAIGFAVPTQFSPDFAAMLVIEALLGQGGDVHAFDFGSNAVPPSDFVGGYYQFEADPGTLVEFYTGAGIDQDLHDLADAVTRLRAAPLADDVLSRAKRAALGQYLTSINTLDDQSWLLERCVLSPSGAALENALPARIAAVTAADVKRVADAYLAIQTTAIVLPNTPGQ
jgi:predicted Zn-dependent peptidase